MSANLVFYGKKIKLKSTGNYLIYGKLCMFVGDSESRRLCRETDLALGPLSQKLAPQFEALGGLPDGRICKQNFKAALRKRQICSRTTCLSKVPLNTPAHVKETRDRVRQHLYNWIETQR